MAPSGSLIPLLLTAFLMLAGNGRLSATLALRIAPPELF